MNLESFESLILERKNEEEELKALEGKHSETHSKKRLQQCHVGELDVISEWIDNTNEKDTVVSKIKFA